jgi:hypothetical protein
MVFWGGPLACVSHSPVNYVTITPEKATNTIFLHEIPSTYPNFKHNNVS